MQKVIFIAVFVILLSPSRQCTNKSLSFNPEEMIGFHKAKTEKFDQYVPPTKEHLVSSVGSFHPMKIHSDITGLDWLKTKKPEIYRWIVNKLIPACTKHMHDTFRVPETQMNRVSVSKCAEVSPIPYTVKRSLPVDLILMFTAQATQSDSFVAWASPCQLHQTTLRPIVGQVNMNPYFLSMDEKLFFDQFATVLHEIYHVLGFSSALYGYFVDSSYKRKPLYKTFNEQKLEIVSPRVVQHAREYFGCPSVTGVKLENNGGSGSQGSHWEKTVLGNEVMVANQVANPVISKFTLKLMEDSGWYHINWEMAEPFFWSKGNGCGAAMGECRLQGHTCKSKGQEGCFYDFTFQATCTSDTYSDMCNFFTGTDFKRHDCREDNSDYNSKNLGEEFGMGSRCFEGKMVSNNHYHGNMCYKTKCVGDSKIQLYIGDKFYECTSDRQQINPKGFQGYVTCPVIKEFCEQKNKSCKDDCNTNGRCLNDKRCWCYPGNSGSSCKTIGGEGGYFPEEGTNPKPKPNPNPNPYKPKPKPVAPKCPNNCNGNNGNCVNAKCECYYPWSGLDCSQRKCPNNCSQKGQCKNGKCVCFYGYSGTYCQTKISKCPNDCSKNGICYNGHCFCNNNYSGYDCSIKRCPSDCFGRGKCYSGKCICNSGYTGLNCGSLEKEKTCPNNCFNRGTCKCSYSSCRCYCKPCYFGSDCRYKSGSYSCWYSLKENMEGFTIVAGGDEN